MALVMFVDVLEVAKDMLVVAVAQVEAGLVPLYHW